MRISVLWKWERKSQRKMTKLFIIFFRMDVMISTLFHHTWWILCSIFHSWNGLDSVKQQKHQQFQYFSISRKFNFAIANFWCMLRHTERNLASPFIDLYPTVSYSQFPHMVMTFYSFFLSPFNSFGRLNSTYLFCLRLCGIKTASNWINRFTSSELHVRE